MASKMLMLLAVLVALLVVSEARPGGKKGIPGGLPGGFPGGLPTRTINMPIMPAGTFGPMPPSPGAGFPLDDEPDSLESLASDPFGSVGKLLGGGGGGGGGMKKLLIIG